MNAEDVAREHQGHDSDPTQKLPDSETAGRDDGIPNSGDGVGVGAGTEPNTFEPEEDPDASDDVSK